MSYQLRKIGLPASDEKVKNFYKLTSSTTKIGRGESADIFLDSNIWKKLISREHAQIKQTIGNNEEPVYSISDTSVNGTYVNDVRVKGSVVLKEGDKVAFGHLCGALILPGEWGGPQIRTEFLFKFEKCLPEVRDLVDLLEEELDIISSSVLMSPEPSDSLLPEVDHISLPEVDHVSLSSSQGTIEMVQSDDSACNSSDIYPYVYHFLVDNGLTETAKCFEKESRTVLHKPVGIDLFEIFSKYVFLEKEGLYSKVPLVNDDVCDTKTQEKGKKLRKKRKLAKGVNKDTKPKKKEKKEDTGTVEEDSKAIVTKNGILEQLSVSDKTLKKKKKKMQKNNIVEKVDEIPQVNHTSKLSSIKKTLYTQIKEEETVVHTGSVSSQPKAENDEKFRIRMETKRDSAHVGEAPVREEEASNVKNKIDSDILIEGKDVVKETAVKNKTVIDNHSVEKKSCVMM